VNSHLCTTLNERKEEESSDVSFRFDAEKNPGAAAPKASPPAFFSDAAPDGSGCIPFARCRSEVSRVLHGDL